MSSCFYHPRAFCIMTLALIASSCLASVAQADSSKTADKSAAHHITTQQVDYQDGQVELQGQLAVRDDIKPDGKTPAVLIVHEWWGLNDYAIMRAKKIAALGYVAFALDMYGQGRHSDQVDDAKAWSSQFYGKPLMAQRAQAGLDALLKDPRVDPDNIIVIGYCFGGTVAIDLAYSGAKIKGAVSFHGTPALPTEAQAKHTKARLLILTGSEDPMYNTKARVALEEALNQTSIDWSVVVYGKAMHSFTNPNAGKYNIPGVAYNKNADTQSWLALQSFMKQVFTNK